MKVPTRQPEDPLNSPQLTLFPTALVLEPVGLTFLQTLDPGQPAPTAQTQEVHYIFFYPRAEQTDTTEGRTGGWMLAVGARLRCLWPPCCWFRSCLGIEHTCLKVTPSLSSWNNVWGGCVYQADSTAEEAASHPPVLHVSSVIQAALHVLSINDVTRQNLVNAIFNLLFVDLLNIHSVSVNLLTLLLIARVLFFLASSMGWQDDGVYFLVTKPWIAHYIS